VLVSAVGKTGAGHYAKWKGLYGSYPPVRG